ncbi:SDR family oxidoreductase [Nocardioides sp. AN3]
MDLNLNGRTAIVCGASSGLGLATSEALKAEGANVVMFARRRDLLEQEAERIGATAVHGDSTNSSDLANLVEQTVQAFGGLDILVLNSGGPKWGPAAEVTAKELEVAVRLVLAPAVTMVGLALPHLRRSLSARVVVFTSASAKAPIANLALSNMTRPALTGWAKTLSRELGPEGITVNCVAPGYIFTSRLQGAYPDGPPVEHVADIPLGRWGTPDEFADVVCFLASDRARYVNGVTLSVDGGLTPGLY